MRGSKIQVIFSCLGAIMGLAAAYFWYVSASIHIPTDNIKSAWGTIAGVETVTAALDQSASLNSLAAKITAVATLCQAFSFAPPRAWDLVRRALRIISIKTFNTIRNLTPR